MMQALSKEESDAGALLPAKTWSFLRQHACSNKTLKVLLELRVAGGQGLCDAIGYSENPRDWGTHDAGSVMESFLDFCERIKLRKGRNIFLAGKQYGGLTKVGQKTANRAQGTTY